MVTPKNHNFVTNKYECSSVSHAMIVVVRGKIIHLGHGKYSCEWWGWKLSKSRPACLIPISW